VVSCAFVAHLLEIAVWAVLFLLCGEFPEFGTATTTLRSTTRPRGTVM
jgi:hypothetical protein